MCRRLILSLRLAANSRAPSIEGFPEVSEIEVIRHFTRLSTWNYAIDLGMYPLGSCTMKYNPRVNEFVARLDGLASEHPQQPAEVSQGCLRILWDLQNCLLAITGMDAATLQPAAGAQGELAGLLMIRAYLASKGNPRTKVLIPDSAHGTNPASVVIAGYEVQNIRSNARGQIDTDHLREFVTEDVAALMLTNPSTLGVFRGAHCGNCGDPARKRRAAVHGRRQHERSCRRHAARRFRRRRDALEPAQDLFDAARWRRPRFRPRDGEENSRTVSAGARRREERKMDNSRSIRIARNRLDACAPTAAISAFCSAPSPTRWLTAPGFGRPPKTPL